jgi:predicted HicB family RNase H-like nuclease
MIKSWNTVQFYHVVIIQSGEGLLYTASQRGVLMAYSDAQKEATARYNKKTYDRIEIKVKKGQKDKIFQYAAQHGKSVTQFIVDLIDEAMAEPEETGE